MSKMTHSYQQTYLSKLAFADPDKKNQLHDLGCQYLAQKEKALKLLELVIPNDEDNARPLAIRRIEVSAGVIKCSFGYQSVTQNITGYYDLLVLSPGWRVAVEVKLAKTSINEVLQQLETYRINDTDGQQSHTKYRQILATFYHLNAHEKLLCEREGITTIFLDAAIVESFAKSLVTTEEPSF